MPDKKEKNTKNTYEKPALTKEGDLKDITRGISAGT